MGAQEDGKVIDNALWVHPKKAVIFVRVVCVLDERHLLRAPQPMRKQPELVAKAVKTGAHQIYWRHVREVCREKRRHLQMLVSG